MPWLRTVAGWWRAIRLAPVTMGDVEGLRARIAASDRDIAALRAQRDEDHAAIATLHDSIAKESDAQIAALRARIGDTEAGLQRSADYATAVLTELRYRADVLGAEAAELRAKDAQTDATIAASMSAAAESAALLARHAATIEDLRAEVMASADHPGGIDVGFPALPGANGGNSAGWLYAGFEETFRGTRAEISARLEPYLTYADMARALGKPALDVGCGRGEWLEMMRRHGPPAMGVDTNPAIVSFGRALGYDVHHGDAVGFLDGGAADAYSLVTAFHVVEHLPVPRVVALLAAVARSLAPGGYFIVETPDPDNLLVGGSSFWLDPTHVRPLPRPLMRFLVEAIGLEFVESKGLHEDAALGERAVLEGWPAGLREVLCGPRDYAIVARRSAG